MRKRGVHQKGSIQYVSKPEIDYKKPLVLVVICQKRWIQDLQYQQDYAVVVNVEHETKVGHKIQDGLFNKIKIRNQERAKIMLGKK